MLWTTLRVLLAGTLLTAVRGAEVGCLDPGQAARLQVTALALAVAAFERDLGRLPSREEGLAALLECPAGAAAERWQGPYLVQPPGLVPDPWGRDYVYELRPADAERPFTIYSCGQDGVSASAGNDPDDVGLWPSAGLAAADGPGVSADAGVLRVLRRPLGLVVALTVMVGLLRWYANRAAAADPGHPDGYVRRHRRRRPGAAAAPPRELP